MATANPKVSEEPVRIRCAADLFSVLTTGSLGARLAVLKSVAEDPLRALSLGPHKDEDFIDLLVRLIPQSTGGLRQVQILCLMSYQDPRSTQFLIAEFARSRDPATILRLAERLTLERGFEFFRTFLWEGKPTQALAVARLCRQNPDLEAADTLRVAILLDRDYEPPELTEENMPLWMNELKGPHRMKAMQLAESRGAEVLHLWAHWSEFDERVQRWLLGQTALLDLALFKAKVTRMLGKPEVAHFVVDQAVNRGVELPAGLLRNECPRVRAHCISAGHADDRLESFLASERSLEEALAATNRTSPQKLLGLLSDSRWQVRALATQLLSTQDSPPPLAELRLKVHSESIGERVAATKLLQQFGDEAWLQENLGEVS